MASKSEKQDLVPRQPSVSPAESPQTSVSETEHLLSQRLMSSVKEKLHPGEGVALALWLIAVVLAGRYFYTISVHHVGTVAASNDGWFGVDLRDALWQPIRDLFDGRNPYDAPAYVARHPGAAEFDLYSPDWLLAAGPVAALPWQAAIAVWSLCTQVMAVILAIVTCRIARLPKQVWVLPLVLVIILRTFPEYVAQLGGNPSLVVAPIAAVALWRAKDDKLTVAALAVALIKPQFGVPIAFILLAAGRWRCVLRAVAVTIVASLVPLVMAIINSDGVGDFVHSLGRNLDYASTSSASGVIGSDLRRVDLAALISHANDGYLSSLPTLAIALMFIGIACWAYRGYREHDWPTRVRCYAIASGAVIFALPHGRYDLVFVIPALTALAHLALTRDGRPADRAAAIAVVAFGIATLAPNRLLGVIHLQHGTANVVTNAVALFAVVACLAVASISQRRPPTNSAA